MFYHSHFLEPAIFRFVQKHSLDYTFTKIVKTISNLNHSKTTKEQLKLE